MIIYISLVRHFSGRCELRGSFKKLLHQYKDCEWTVYIKKKCVSDASPTMHICFITSGEHFA